MTTFKQFYDIKSHNFVPFHSWNLQENFIKKISGNKVDKHIYRVRDLELTCLITNSNEQALKVLNIPVKVKDNMEYLIFLSNF